MDMSRIAENVFSKAIFMAQNEQAELILLHVISSEEDNSPLAIPPNMFDLYPASGNELTVESWQEEWEEYIDTGIKFLESYQKKAIANNLKVKHIQLQGSAGRTICKLAKQEEADLIIMGRRGRTGITEMFLGSVSNYVLHHAHCSVLIIQKQPETLDN